MTDSNIFKLNKPEQNDPLQEVLCEGARNMLAVAIETEVSNFIKPLQSYHLTFKFFNEQPTGPVAYPNFVRFDTKK